MYELKEYTHTTQIDGKTHSSFCHYLDDKLVAIDFFDANDEMFEEEDRWFFSKFADQSVLVTDEDEIGAITGLLNISKYDIWRP